MSTPTLELLKARLTNVGTINDALALRCLDSSIELVKKLTGQQFDDEAGSRQFNVGLSGIEGLWELPTPLVRFDSLLLDTVDRTAMVRAYSLQGMAPFTHMDFWQMTMAPEERITITGTWGTVASWPASVSQAVLIAAAILYRRVAGGGSFAGTETLPPLFFQLVKPYTL